MSQTALSRKKFQPYKECKIIDETNVVKTVTFFFKTRVNTVRENNVYKITIFLVSKDDGKKVVKTSRNSVFTEINDPETDLPEHPMQDDKNNLTRNMSVIELDTIK